jgi:hypothetical protein
VSKRFTFQKKIDKKRTRFRFVKFQEVGDVGELLSRLGYIWFGAFKLHVNLCRFNKGTTRKEETLEVPGSNKAAKARLQLGWMSTTISRPPLNYLKVLLSSAVVVEVQ